MNFYDARFEAGKDDPGGSWAPDSVENVQPVRLTRAELDAMREAAEKDQRDPHGNDGVAVVRTVERILAARLAPILALADDLAAWDLVDMPVPDSVDVPDDYELGMNDAGAQLHAALRHAALRVIPPEECPNADLHSTFAGMECGRCGTVIPPDETRGLDPESRHR